MLRQRATIVWHLEIMSLLDGAYATFEENIKGSITPSKLADFVVLEKDPRKASPDMIQDIVIEATYVGGEKVYTGPPKATPIVPQPRLNYGDGNYGDGDEKKTKICMFTEFSRLMESCHCGGLWSSIRRESDPQVEEIYHSARWRSGRSETSARPVRRRLSGNRSGRCCRRHQICPRWRSCCGRRSLHF